MEIIENIKLDLQVKYLNNLIIGCKKVNINTKNIEKELKKISDVDVDNYSITEKYNLNSEKIDYLYLKPWSKLTLIHKIIKIKEFINNLNINNDEESDIIKEKLINFIKDKKKFKINYDENKGKITSISNLTFENNKYKLID